MDPIGAVGGIGMMIIMIFVVVLAILWFILPFAVFGLKSRMDRILTEIRQTNDLLNENVQYMKRLTDEAEKKLGE